MQGNQTSGRGPTEFHAVDIIARDLRFDDQQNPRRSFRNGLAIFNDATRCVVADADDRPESGCMNGRALEDIYSRTLVFATLVAFTETVIRRPAAQIASLASHMHFNWNRECGVSSVKRSRVAPHFDAAGCRHLISMWTERSLLRFGARFAIQMNSKPVSRLSTIT